MELKFTFEDGSEAYLQHYGVKGMKWKDHMAKPEDEEKKNKKRAKTLRNISKSLTKAAKGPEAKKAKAKVKAHFSTKQGRKHLRAKGVVIEDLGNGKSKTTYY